MSLLVESIKVEQRTVFNANLHSARMNRTRQDLFGCTDAIDLQKVLRIPDDLSDGIYKCRILYNETIQRIEFQPYIPRKVTSLQLVVDEEIHYAYKYEDRTRIDQLKRLSTADDILIVQKECITDASRANVVFFDGHQWITPSLPLLHGTRRQALLEEGRILEDELRVKDLHHFQKAVLINAMCDLNENICIDMKNVS
jgi:4-amino-4-deoxychorismate lyase